MKRKFIIGLLAFLGFTKSSFSQQTTTQYHLREITTTAFDKIVVNASIDIMLVQDDTLQTAYLEGSEVLASEISLKVKHNVLYVQGKKSSSYKGKLLLTIPVKALAGIEINEPADVSSINLLQSQQLTVKANDNSKMRIHVTGKFLVETAEDLYIDRWKQTLVAR